MTQADRKRRQEQADAPSGTASQPQQVF